MAGFNINKYRDSFFDARILSVILAIAVFVRLKGISNFYFNPDEAWFLTIASRPSITEVVRFNNFDNAHPLFYPVLLHGILMISNEIEFLRLVSIIPGIGIVVLAYIYGLKFIGRPAAIFMALATAFSFQLVMLAGILREYSWLVFLIFLGIFMISKYSKEMNRRYLLFYFLAMLFATQTDYISALIVAGFGPGILYLTIKNQKHSVLWLLVNSILGAIFIMSYYFQIWSGPYGLYNHTVTQSALSWAFPKSTDGYLENLVGIIRMLFAPLTLFQALAYITLPLGLVALSARKKLLLPSTLFITLLLNMVATAWLKIYPFSTSRHSIYLFPLAAIISGYGFQELYSYIKPVLFKINARVANRIYTSSGQVVILTILTTGVCIMGINELAKRNYYKNGDFCEYTITKDDYKRVMSALTAVRSNDIVMTEKQTMWYLLYSLPELEIYKASPIEANARYKNLNIYYWDQRGILQVTMQRDADFKALLNDLTSVLPRDIDKVWFFGIGCGSSIPKSIFTGHPIPVKSNTTLRNIFSNQYMAVYNLDWDSFKHQLLK